jgi:hypothetical protein
MSANTLRTKRPKIAILGSDLCPNMPGSLSDVSTPGNIRATLEQHLRTADSNHSTILKASSLSKLLLTLSFTSSFLCTSMLTEKDIQQLGKSYGGQAPSSDVRYIVEQAFRELQSRWRYADNDAKKSEMEVDFTKLQELKGNVKSLNADAQYELFMLASSNDMSTFRFALDKVVLSYIRSFGKILARNDVARGGWDGKQYATQSIANDPVYREFYTLLPKLSSEESETI